MIKVINKFCKCLLLFVLKVELYIWAQTCHCFRFSEDVGLWWIGTRMITSICFLSCFSSVFLKIFTSNGTVRNWKIIHKRWYVIKLDLKSNSIVWTWKPEISILTQYQLDFVAALLIYIIVPFMLPRWPVLTLLFYIFELWKGFVGGNV